MVSVLTPVDELRTVELADRVYWVCAAAMLLNEELALESINYHI